LNLNCLEPKLIVLYLIPLPGAARDRRAREQNQQRDGARARAAAEEGRAAGGDPAGAAEEAGAQLARVRRGVLEAAGDHRGARRKPAVGARACAWAWHARRRGVEVNVKRYTNFVFLILLILEDIDEVEEWRRIR
jgi:hypothetical protein